MSACGQCHQIFSYNPHLVPSLNDVPFCRNCVERANPKRIANGLEPINILPGAYESVAETPAEEMETDYQCDQEYYDPEEPMTPYDSDDEFEDEFNDDIDRDDLDDYPPAFRP